MSKEKNSQAYLAQVFSQEVFSDLDKVVALRRAWRDQRIFTAGGKAKVGPPPRRSAGQTSNHQPVEEGARLRWEQELHRIDQVMFEANAAEIRRALDAIPVAQFPDLAATVARRKRVAGALDAIHYAAEGEGIDPRLWKDFLRILTASKRDASELKRDWMRRMKQTSFRRRGVPFAKRIASTHPEVYALESNWLQTTMNAKRILADSSKPLGFLGCLGAYFVINAIVTLIRYFLEN